MSIHDNTDFDQCLCCGKKITEPVPMTPERAPKALKFLISLGYTFQDLITKHRTQLQYQAPGLIEWLEAQNDQKEI
jgi:hypothetical protein